ncbi:MULTISPECIES: aminotransferase class V-fold PLP-dependent enzyme [Catenuloplanes]|uniref:Selenocysteine lyase/cysteine desulfurase n=1 Tax=Catenuloplanes niger TaxID=587534 RepID=A0AAE3ZJV1_9ACTN|nr:aminotransferase class V-fold PLP-dependent enzyme [Catenuloplanes niger]MDR7320521.1 selenocysteine lyase/cysteine desulfurase [Catenuloplanes niger]
MENLDVAALRADTPGCARVVHLNNAGSSLPPAPVLDAMTGHLRLEAEIGGYEAADARAEQIQDFYTEAAALLGAQPAEIAFANNSTHAYATALSAIDFAPGDVVLTTRDDYISNQIAFLSLARRRGVRVVHAPDAPGGGVDVDAMAALMRAHRPRLVAVTHVPTSSGLIAPVAAIGRHCRELDLLYLVDACQSIGQVPLDVTEIGADLLTATGRKFLRGPRGTGLLYVSARVLAAGYEPLFIDMRGAHWTEPGAYRPVATAARFEDWEFPYAGLLGLSAAIRYARRIGVPALSRRAVGLAASLRDRLREIDGVTVLDRGPALGAIVTCAVDGAAPAPLKATLTGHGINSSVTLREHARFDFADKGIEWCLRLSPHYFNTEGEIDRVVDVLTDC